MGEQLQFLFQYNEIVYAEYNSYLQVRQRKNLTRLHGNIRTRRPSVRRGRQKLLISFPTSPVSSRVPKKPLTFVFDSRQVVLSALSNSLPQARKTPLEAPELLYEALVRPRRGLSNRWSPQAPQPDSSPDAACMWPHVSFLYSSIVSLRTFLWWHQGTFVCFYVWQQDLCPEALCVCVFYVQTIKP